VSRLLLLSMYLYFSKKWDNRDKWSAALWWSGFWASRFLSRFVPVGTGRDGRCARVESVTIG